MSVQLSVVSPSPETPAQRANRLMAEAKAAAQEQITALEQALAQVADLAAQIVDGGDIYPAGVRDLCRRMADEAVWKTQTLDAILNRK